MFEQKLLEGMEKAGYGIEATLKILGISRTAYYRKRKGITQFTIKEVAILIKVLPEEYKNIFFELKVS